jgi:hypothetical protein
MIEDTPIIIYIVVQSCVKYWDVRPTWRTTSKAKVIVVRKGFKNGNLIE